MRGGFTADIRAFWGGTAIHSEHFSDAPKGYSQPRLGLEELDAEPEDGKSRGIEVFAANAAPEWNKKE